MRQGGREGGMEVGRASSDFQEVLSGLCESFEGFSTARSLILVRMKKND